MDDGSSALSPTIDTRNSFQTTHSTHLPDDASIADVIVSEHTSTMNGEYKHSIHHLSMVATPNRTTTTSSGNGQRGETTSSSQCHQQSAPTKAGGGDQLNPGSSGTHGDPGMPGSSGQGDGGGGSGGGSGPLGSHGVDEDEDDTSHEQSSGGTTTTSSSNRSVPNIMPPPAVSSQELPGSQHHSHSVGHNGNGYRSQSQESTVSESEGGGLSDASTAVVSDSDPRWRDLQPPQLIPNRHTSSASPKVTSSSSSSGTQPHSSADALESSIVSTMSSCANTSSSASSAENKKSLLTKKAKSPCPLSSSRLSELPLSQSFDSDGEIIGLSREPMSSTPTDSAPISSQPLVLETQDDDRELFSPAPDLVVIEDTPPEKIFSPGTGKNNVVKGENEGKVQVAVTKASELTMSSTVDQPSDTTSNKPPVQLSAEQLATGVEISPIKISPLHPKVTRHSVRLSPRISRRIQFDSSTEEATEKVTPPSRKQQALLITKRGDQHSNQEHSSTTAQKIKEKVNLESSDDNGNTGKSPMENESTEKISPHQQELIGDATLFSDSQEPSPSILASPSTMTTNSSEDARKAEIRMTDQSFPLTQYFDSETTLNQPTEDVIGESQRSLSVNLVLSDEDECDSKVERSEPDKQDQEVHVVSKQLSNTETPTSEESTTHLTSSMEVAETDKDEPTNQNEDPFAVLRQRDLSFAMMLAEPGPSGMSSQRSMHSDSDSEESDFKRRRQVSKQSVREIIKETVSNRNSSASMGRKGKGQGKHSKGSVKETCTSEVEDSTGLPSDVPSVPNRDQTPVLNESRIETEVNVGAGSVQSEPEVQQEHADVENNCASGTEQKTPLDTCADVPSCVEIAEAEDEEVAKIAKKVPKKLPVINRTLRRSSRTVHTRNRKGRGGKAATAALSEPENQRPLRQKRKPKGGKGETVSDATNKSNAPVATSQSGEVISPFAVPQSRPRTIIPASMPSPIPLVSPQSVPQSESPCSTPQATQQTGNSGAGTKERSESESISAIRPGQFVRRVVETTVITTTTVIIKHTVTEEIVVDGRVVDRTTQHAEEPPQTTRHVEHHVPKEQVQNCSPPPTIFQRSLSSSTSSSSTKQTNTSGSLADISSTSSSRPNSVTPTRSTTTVSSPIPIATEVGDGLTVRHPPRGADLLRIVQLRTAEKDGGLTPDILAMKQRVNSKLASLPVMDEIPSDTGTPAGAIKKRGLKHSPRRSPRKRQKSGNGSTDPPRSTSSIHGSSPTSARASSRSVVSTNESATSDHETTDSSTEHVNTDASQSTGQSSRYSVVIPVSERPRLAPENTEVIRDIGEGVRVMAKWKDERFYPGEVKNRDKAGDWVVHFDDGFVQSVEESNVLGIEALPAGVSVYGKLNADDDYEPGIIVGNDMNEGELFYVVELDTHGTNLIRESFIMMSNDQIMCLTGDSPGLSTSAADAASISLGNIVDSKRRSLNSTTTTSSVESPPPRTTPTEKQTTTKQSASAQKDSATSDKSSGHEKPSRTLSVSPEKRKSHKTATTQISKTSPSPSTDAAKRRKISPGRKPKKFTRKFQRKSSPGLVGKLPKKTPQKNRVAAKPPLSEKSAKKTPHGVSSSDDNVTPAKFPKRHTKSPGRPSLRTPKQASPVAGKVSPGIGSLPSTKLFQKMKFLLTSAEKIATVKSPKEKCDSSVDEISEDEQPIPFDKDLVRKQIEKGGGKVMTTIDEMQAAEGYFLISNNHVRTMKYLRCLAMAVPCVSHEWITNSCHLNELLDYRSYLLPTGVNIVEKKLVEWHSQCNVLGSLSVHLASTPENPDFVEVWQPVLVAAGATLHTRLSVVASDASQLKVDVVVADTACSRAIVRRCRKLGITIVSTEWIVQCLINGKQLTYDAHPKFSYDFMDN